MKLLHSLALEGFLLDASISSIPDIQDSELLEISQDIITLLIHFFVACIIKYYSGGSRNSRNRESGEGGGSSSLAFCLHAKIYMYIKICLLSRKHFYRIKNKSAVWGHWIRLWSVYVSHKFTTTFIFINNTKRLFQILYVHYDYFINCYSQTYPWQFLMPHMGKYN